MPNRVVFDSFISFMLVYDNMTSAMKRNPASTPTITFLFFDRIGLYELRVYTLTWWPSAVISLSTRHPILANATKKFPACHNSASATKGGRHSLLRRRI